MTAHKHDPAQSLTPLATRLANHIATMADHQRARYGGKLIIEAATEVSALTARLQASEERERTLRDRLIEIGEVYVYPNDWSCAKAGTYPPIEAYEKIDLADLANSAPT